MLKKMALITLGLGLAFQAQAFDKNQINLQKDFFGNWTIYNAKNKCSETYKFIQADKFQYTSLNKRMTGVFGVLRDKNSPNSLDILSMKIATDNKHAACAGVAQDFTNVNLNLPLKWISPNTAQLCTDSLGTKCLDLYLIKQ